MPSIRLVAMEPLGIVTVGEHEAGNHAPVFAGGAEGCGAGAGPFAFGGAGTGLELAGVLSGGVHILVPLDEAEAAGGGSAGVEKWHYASSDIRTRWLEGFCSLARIA